MVECVQEVFVADDTTEDALIVAEEYERKLTCDCDGGAELEASPVPIKVWCFEHVAM